MFSGIPCEAATGLNSRMSIRFRLWGILLRYYRDNGKENGNSYTIIGYILSCLDSRVQGLGFRV